MVDNNLIKYLYYNYVYRYKYFFIDFFEVLKSYVLQIKKLNPDCDFTKVILYILEHFHLN